jgi:hypothetical protein
MLLRLSETHARRQPARTSAGTNVTLAVVPQSAAGQPGTMPWPKRPSPSVLSKSIPLFFISRDSDGFWIACEADFRIGGIFLSQRSAVRFAQRCSKPTGCATMTLSEAHRLDIENRGNRFVARLRPAKRQVRRLASRLAVLVGTTFTNVHALGARWSRAHIEHRLLKAALEVELYRGRYKHSNKNDDDLPIVSGQATPTLARTANDQAIVSAIKRVLPIVNALAIFTLILAGILGLGVATWVPGFFH